MKMWKRTIPSVILLTLLAPIFTLWAEDQPKPKMLEIPDMLEWKSIRSTVVSNNGEWLAYGIFPAEGNGQVIIKNLPGTKADTFAVGSSGSRIAFSDDSRWAAFSILPKFKELEKLKKQKEKAYNKLALINLKTGEKTEFEKIKRFSFSKENPDWLAMQKYVAESQSKAKEKWKGSDLLLYELASGKTLNIGNVAEFSFNKKGTFLAWIIDAFDKSGNGVQIRNMKTGVITPLESDEAEYKSLNWTEKGDALTMLKGKKDDDFKDKLYSVIGFKSFKKAALQKFIYDPAEDDHFPEKMTVSPARKPYWTDDLSAFIFGIHEIKEKDTDKKKLDKKKTETDKKGDQKEVKKDKEKKASVKNAKKDDEKLPDMVIWHWLDKRMQSQQWVQESRDKNYNYLCIYHVKDKKFIRIADDELRTVSVAPKQRWAIGYDNRDYQRMGNLDGRHYQDVYAINLKTGKRDLILKKSRWAYFPSPDGTHYLYYKNCNFFTYEMSTGKHYNITKNVPTSFINTEDDHNVINPPTRPLGWSKGGKSVLLSDNWDIWNVPVHGGKSVNLTGNGKSEQIRYRRRFRLDPEEKGFDLSVPNYVTAYGEWTKKGGIARISAKKPGAKMLLWDNAVFSGLMKAKKTDLFLYTKQTYKDYPDYYAADKSLQNGRKITGANPQQKDFLWCSGARLVNYKSKTGKKLQAALFLPANYQEGKSYPTIVYIYEKLSQSLNRYPAPRVRGFNQAFYTSHGYAVLMPDITYKINDPGMSAVWCVLPAIDAAVATGVVDKNAIGLHGYSWGGYQTAFLVTQTETFKAAFAGAPLTNMISMYSSIYWNSGSADQPIFESSQGRFKGGYWDNLEAYTRNSPVYYAQNVKTPLIILHNDKDGAVDWNQGIEYFNTLRRLNKPVVMLEYKGENHGLRKPENLKDYTVRMLEFFDHYLKGKPAPKWLSEGVPYLKLKEHLKERQKLLQRPEEKEKEKPKKEKES